MAEQVRVGIIGASGYTGAELLRLIALHPRLRLAYVAAQQNAGRTLAETLPSTAGVAGIGDLTLEAFQPDQAASLSSRVDVMFLCLPHSASAITGKSLLDAGLKVVDLSADFRLKDREVYEKTYGQHPAPELLAQAVYGLPELHRKELAGARLIAAPGCYPTSAILPLVPLLRAGLIEPNGIVIDSKSGVSGAGRTPDARSHFSETAEGIRPYKIAGTHRHTPEIEQELSLALGTPLRVTFTPHLVPMTRGILTTAYARPKAGVAKDGGSLAEKARKAASELYAGGLVTVLPDGKLPDTLWVRGSARAHVAYAYDSRTETVIAMGAIDNLARGASAQAIHALNVSLGWPDAEGLPELGLFP
jgi:N-acetyl-gamma-glutamyl-phosphate reductase